MKMTRLASLGALCLVASCGVVGPDFERPGFGTTQAFAFTPRLALKQAAEDDWWKAYKEPLLDKLVKEAMTQNLDLERARSRIEAARALQGTVGRNAQLSGAVTGQVTVGDAGSSSTRVRAQGGFQPAFIIDLFGEHRRGSEGAQAQVDAEEFDRAAIRLAVQLELVESYLNLRAQEALLVEQNRSVRNRRRIVDVLQQRYAVNDATLIDLRRAEAVLATVQAQVPTFVGARRLSAQRIATLLAQPLQEILPQLEDGNALPAPRAGVYAGVPAALLRNRPDIRRAEADFAVTVAEIGVREAQLYPSLSISGNMQAASFSTVTLGPVLTLPILDRPARRARLANAQARATEAQTVWRQTVLNAIEEVQIALINLEEADERMTRLEDSAQAYRSAQRLVNKAFDIGAATLSEVLDTEENAASVRAETVRARLAYGQAWAQLNVAVGQGWHRPDAVN